MFTTGKIPQMRAVLVESTISIVVISHNRQSLFGKFPAAAFRIPWTSGTGKNDGVSVANLEKFVLKFAICRNPQISFGRNEGGASCILKPLKVQIYLDLHQWRKYRAVNKELGMYSYLENLYDSSKMQMIARRFQGAGKCICVEGGCTCKGEFRALIAKLDDVYLNDEVDDLSRRHVPLRFLWIERMHRVQMKNEVLEKIIELQKLPKDNLNLKE